jgi:aspartyl-tRNA(Asn)/glutamyl-tRNA(Gln) amidotransferase subunit C
MSTFSRADVARLARLARLELSEDEQDLFARQLTGILAYADAVQRADTSGIDPTAYTLAATGPLREDAVRPSLDRDVALANAPAASAETGLYKVPRVLA